jgi:hypothetical protein
MHGTTSVMRPAHHQATVVDSVLLMDLHHRAGWAYEETRSRRFRGIGDTQFNALVMNHLVHARSLGDRFWELGAVDTNCDDYIDPFELATALSSSKVEVVEHFTGCTTHECLWNRIAAEAKPLLQSPEVLDRLLSVAAAAEPPTCTAAVPGRAAKLDLKSACDMVVRAHTFARDYVDAKAWLASSGASADDAQPVPLSLAQVPDDVLAALPLPLSLFVHSPPVSAVFTASALLQRRGPITSARNTGLATSLPPKFPHTPSRLSESFRMYTDNEAGNARSINGLKTKRPMLVCINDDINGEYTAKKVQPLLDYYQFMYPDPSPAELPEPVPRGSIDDEWLVSMRMVHEGMCAA